MSSRGGVRLRIVLAVTALFAVSSIALAVVLLDVVESQLVDDRFDDASAELSTYVDGLSGTTEAATLPSLAASPATSRVFLFDSEGQLVDPPTAASPISSESLTLSLGDATSTLTAGEVSEVDLGDEVAAVATSVTIGADEFTVALANPLQPVLDSVDAVRTALWFALPLLVALVGGLAYYVTGRALRPVRSMTAQVQAIDDSRLAERVPVPAGDDEIHELAVTMNGMLDRIEASQGRQRQLAADASHELRSPVAASRTQLEVALSAPDTADWPATARSVLAETEQLGTLIDDLLLLSRVDSGEAAAPMDVDLDDVVRMEAARTRRVPVSTVIPEPVRVRAVPAQLVRAVRNLVDNAADHAREQVVVSLDPGERLASIHVDDDGPGVPEADRGRVFERFVRLDDARDRGAGGTGLGLAIAREVARAHGGDVTIDESPLGGARFSLTLPR